MPGAGPSHDLAGATAGPWAVRSLNMGVNSSYLSKTEVQAVLGVTSFRPVAAGTEVRRLPPADRAARATRPDR